MLTDHYLIRNIEFDDLLEKFFVSAILAILGIRLFLHLTGYPQLGGGGLHIAHMLWGGLLMLVSIVLLLTFLNRSVARLAAIIGGFGFGTFIDELGKFITSDNNYFYKPTVALIYIIFILLFLAFRALRTYSSFSPAEYLANSIELVKESAVNELTAEDKKKALAYLSKADQDSKLTLPVKDLCGRLDTIAVPKPGIFIRLKRLFFQYYSRVIKQRWFTKVVIAFFLVEAISGFLLILWILFWIRRGFVLPIPIAEIKKLGFADVMTLLSSALAGIFVILGVIRIKRSRLSAYEMFMKSMLISIFFVQVFSFYKNQLQAFFGLLFNILVLLALKQMIEGEKALSMAGEDKNSSGNAPTG